MATASPKASYWNWVNYEDVGDGFVLVFWHHFFSPHFTVTACTDHVNINYRKKRQRNRMRERGSKAKGAKVQIFWRLKEKDKSNREVWVHVCVCVRLNVGTSGNEIQSALHYGGNRIHWKKLVIYLLWIKSRATRWSVYRRGHWAAFDWWLLFQTSNKSSKFFHYVLVNLQTGLFDSLTLY